jgi:hypothetical protein
MAIGQNDDESGSPTLYTFGNLHGQIIEGPYLMPVQTLTTPGLIGEAHLIDEAKSRPLSCYFRLSGYSTYGNLVSALTTLDSKIGKLVGSVILTGTLASTWPRCTFVGFERSRVPTYDGSGQNGWWIEGQLRWIQRAS